MLVAVTDWVSVFQPTLPARGATRRSTASCPSVCTFQPTLPARGATEDGQRHDAHQFISTHAPRTGSDSITTEKAPTFHNSTHAPRTGSDGDLRRALKIGNVFQPTLPARGATEGRRQAHDYRGISTHAPRTGSDGCGTLSTNCKEAYFNPRSPHGERRPPPCPPTTATAHFNPRSPHGERPAGCGSPRRKKWPFQPTLPARGATSTARTLTSTFTHFNPRSPHGERPTTFPFKED